jgi:hypothetical protein
MIAMRLLGRILGALLLLLPLPLLPLLLLLVSSLSSTGSHDSTRSTPQHLLPDSVVIPFANHHRFTNLTKFSTSRGIAVHIFQTTEAWSVVAPTEHNNNNNISKLQTTLRQAQINGCGIGATNGGPFNPDGTSSGPLVLKGKLHHHQSNHHQQTDESSDYIGFGTTRNKEWVLGSFAQVRHLDPWDFVTGFNWLVYDGTMVANNSQNPTGAYQAARTAIGVDWNSTLLLIVSDGCERWYVTLRHCDSIIYVYWRHDVFLF